MISARERVEKALEIAKDRFTCNGDDMGDCYLVNRDFTQAVLEGYLSMMDALERMHKTPGISGFSRNYLKTALASARAKLEAGGE